ncbi:MAG: hypothetical protein HZA92_07175 [Verrucomicrobia bacterium]|nr:hypothetical protein [Verrucomicrobiota bacterium]
MPESQNRPPSGVEVGPDVVLYFGEKIVVCAAKEMPEWESRESSRPAIEFEDHRYYLSRKLRGDEDRPTRYELAPWPAFASARPKVVIVYDEDYVALRDGAFKKIKPTGGQQTVWRFAYPLLGFFPASFKESVLEPHGINPLRVSLITCLCAYVFFVAELICLFFSFGIFQKFFGPLIWLDYLAVVALPFDSAVRFYQILNRERYPDGFFEWLPKFLRR